MLLLMILLMMIKLIIMMLMLAIISWNDYSADVASKCYDAGGAPIVSDIAAVAAAETEVVSLMFFATSKAY